MEVNAKLKELEEEFKVLKAEIRNVLLDIREVILDRTNPLGEEHESAHLTLDLNTTAHAMAAETAAHEAMKAADEAESSHEDGPHAGDEHGNAHPVSLLTSDEGDEPDVAVTEDNPAPSQPGSASAPVATDDAEDSEPAPKVIRRSPSADPALQPEGKLPTEIPPMFQANQVNIPPLSGNISISSWLTQALEAVGPQELERIITIHRLWGNLPSNISRALAYVQEMLQTTDENEPPWLKVMQELDRLAAL